jgi:hypothetical protein
MPHCPTCGFDSQFLSNHASESCPKCGQGFATVRGNENVPSVNVARVSNLAEAGFLSDELIGLDIDARIYQTEDFSEFGGWKTHYLIRVPTGVAQQAAAQIRSHVVEAEAEQEDAPFNVSSDAGQLDPAYWRPVALVVLAGVASFVLGRQTAVSRFDPPPAPDSLAAEVDAIGRVFVTEAIPGAPRHRLSFDRPRRVWRLDVDVNGDGIFDVQRQFSASGAPR